MPVPVPEPCEHLKEVRCHLLVLLGRMREASKKGLGLPSDDMGALGGVMTNQGEGLARAAYHRIVMKLSMVVLYVCGTVWYGPNPRRRQCHPHLRYYYKPAVVAIVRVGGAAAANWGQYWTVCRQSKSDI